MPASEVHAALVFQAYASDVQDQSMSEVFGSSADRLMDAATTAKRG